MLYLFLINVDISLLFRRLYSRNSVYLSLQFGPYSVIFFENDAFSATCDVCVGLKPVKPVFWITNTVRYLYSFKRFFVLY